VLRHRGRPRGYPSTACARGGRINGLLASALTIYNLRTMA